jgi:hypothetical protein
VEYSSSRALAPWGSDKLSTTVTAGDERPRVRVYNSAGGMASDIVTCLVEDRQGDERH